MIKFKMFGGESFPLVFKSMEAYALRHKTRSDNIANVMTEDYSRKEVPFEKNLRKALNSSGVTSGYRTNDRHLKLGTPQVSNLDVEFKAFENEEPVNGINSVDIDTEMSELAQNTLRYSLMVTFLTKKLGDIRSAISEGKR